MTKLKSKFSNVQYEAGCDEAGRGCLAGPVVAAAVILPKHVKIDELNDSKQLSHAKRLKVRDAVIKHAISYSIGIADNFEIDNINILKASILSMHRALEQLSVLPEFIIVDGNTFSKYKNVAHECVVKGDSKYMSIAAASVLAKTYRDDIMVRLHDLHPEYNWKQNKGYPTMEHKLALYKYGVSPYHRKTFSWSIQMKLFS
jgi:ribonuclease HII